MQNKKCKYGFYTCPINEQVDFCNSCDEGQNYQMKEARGGKRIGSGRKKADYETKTIAFRVRVEFVEPIKKMVKDYVSERLKGDA